MGIEVSHYKKARNLVDEGQFDAPGGPVELRVDVVNVFDNVYEIRDGTGVGVGAPQFGASRGVFFGVKKSL